MPENTTNTIKSVQFLRNSQVYADFKTLKETVLKSDNGAEFINTSVIANSGGRRTLENIDGTLILLRYRDENSVVNTVIATVHSTGSTATLSLDTSYDVLNDALDTAIKEVTDGAVKVSDVNDAIGTAISKLDLKYDSATAKIQLKNDKGVIGKEVDFPFEAIVESADLLENNKLKIVFNTTNGNQEIVVDLNKLKDIYSAGDGLTLGNDNKFAVKFKVAGEEDLVKLIANPTDGVTVDTTKLNDKLTVLDTTAKTYLTETKAAETYMTKFDNIDLGTF